MPYALFDDNERIGDAASSELEAWRKALDLGLISDIPVADEQGGQVLPRGLTVKRMDEKGGRDYSGILTSRRP